MNVIAYEWGTSCGSYFTRAKAGVIHDTGGVIRGADIGRRGNRGRAEHSVQLDADCECERSTYGRGASNRLRALFLYGAIIIAIYYT